MPYKCPEKARESSRLRQKKYRDKNKNKLNIITLGRYHSIYKKDEEYREASNKRSAEWRLKNKAKVKKYLALNPEQREKARIRAREWQKKNKGRVRANNAFRKKKVKQATPKWVDRKEITAIYEKACRMEEIEGVKYHVDHIIPISSKLVCGLHVACNLQIIPASVNLTKGNKLLN